MNRSITLLTANHLCHNPRVIKEATALAQAGYTVRVLGAWTDSKLKARDRALADGAPFAFVPVLDLTGTAPGSRARRLFHRIVGKSARLAHSWTGRESSKQLAPTVGALGRAARSLRTDLYVAHSEPALSVARSLLAIGRRVAVDMEDWYSEDLLPQARKSRPTGLLRELERATLRGATYSSCPSRAMSQALAREFDCPAPAVIYNVFPWAERGAMDGLAVDRPNRGRQSIHWYSQTLGEGRGLEDLVGALAGIQTDAELHLRGVPAPGFEAWLATRTPAAWRNRVFVHPLVSNHKLLSRIAEHDIGFAGETREIRSRDLTVTNKILHYLLGGLAVVASDTAGQIEVAALAPAAVALYPSGEAPALAAVLVRLLEFRSELDRAKCAALEAASTTFNWEKQQRVLLNAVAQVL